MAFNLRGYLNDKYNNTFSYDEEKDFFASDDSEIVHIEKKKPTVWYTSKDAGDLRSKAQNGDMETFIYLTDRYVETIERALYYYREILNPGIDLNDYRIAMSKALRRAIMTTEPDVKEGAFVKKLLGLYRYAIFNVNNNFNQRKYNVTKSINSRTVSLDERVGYTDHLGGDDEDYENLALSEIIPSVDEGAELAKENARELLQKIIPLIPKEYFELIYEHVINKKSFKDLAEKYGCTGSNLSAKFKGVQKFLQNIRKYSYLVHKELSLGLTFEEIAKKYALKEKQVEYYGQMYDYLHGNGEMPTKKPAGIWNPEAYIKYSVFAQEGKEDEGK